MKQVGANEVVNIEEEEGARIAMNIMAPALMEKVKLSRDICLQEIPLPPAYIKTRLGTLSLTEKYRLRMGALRRYYTSLDRDGNSIRTEKLLFPEPDEELLDGDILILIGSESDLEEFRKGGEE
ncbi:MAG: TrkA C-terminal domain-containing protein [Spirochaetales bacterium]|nr:TrkA C-terminal domain-containing protein [Spirochaetales bacterium]